MTTRWTLLQTILADIGMTSIETRHDLCHQRIDRDTLLDSTIVNTLLTRKPALKQAYSTAKLSCLHANGADKQKTPGVCLIRQLLKANGFRMVPQIESMGYGGEGCRKVVRRWYLVVDRQPTTEQTEQTEQMDTDTTGEMVGGGEVDGNE